MAGGPRPILHGVRSAGHAGLLEVHEPLRPARAEKRAKDMEILSNIEEASWFIENRSYAVYSTNYDSNDLSELMANRNEMNLYERIHKYVKEH